MCPGRNPSPTHAKAQAQVFFVTHKDRVMPHIIAEPCIKTKDTACVKVCPVDCIHPTKDEATFEAAEQLYIDPDTCIDCGLCVDECPVKAIFPEEDLPAEWKSFVEKNTEFYKQ
jgi:ferredoxin